MRWNKTLEAALVSSLVTVVLAAPPIFTDGTVTKPELLMLLGVFLSGIAMYIKEHKPDEITNEMLSKQQDKIDVQADKLADMQQKKDEQVKS